MIEYEIVPDQLRFTRGLPYQLHIVNAGKEGHDFTAPDFFASVELRDAGVLDERRSSLFLQSQEIADIYFVASSQGTPPIPTSKPNLKNSAAARLWLPCRSRQAHCGRDRGMGGGDSRCKDQAGVITRIVSSSNWSA